MPPRPGAIFLPLDVEFMDNDRVVAAGERAAWLYLAMCLRAKRLVSDGRLTEGQINRLNIPGVKQRLDTLVRTGLLTKDGSGYCIVGWSERNSTAAQLEQKALLKAAIGVWANHRRWHVEREQPDESCAYCSGRLVDRKPDRVPDPIPIGDPMPHPTRVPDRSPIGASSTETETEEETETDVGKRKRTRSPEPQRADVEQVCRAMAAAVQRNAGRTPAITAKWRTDARLLIDKDGRDLATVLAVIEFTARDDFWASNIMSVPTLREKFDKLFVKMKGTRPTVVRQQTPPQQTLPAGFYEGYLDDAPDGAA